MNQDKYENWDRQSESLTLGRIVKSRNDGIFSSAGLPGRCGCDCNLPQKIDYQYTAFNGDQACENYFPYLSQIGFHAMFYSMIDTASPFSSQANFMLLRGVKAATLAMVMSLIVLWFYFELGLFSAVFVFLGILLSPSFTLMGKDLWFCVWTNYLPFLVLLYLLRKESLKGNPSEVRIILVGSLAVLINFIFNGYEWVSTTLIMAAIPFFYYWRKDAWPFAKLARRVAWLAVGSILSLLATFTVLVFQISRVKGKFSDGIDWIIFSFQKRAFGGSELPEVYTKQLDHPLRDVFKRYLGGPAYEFPPFITSFMPTIFDKIYFGEFLVVLVILTIIYYYPGNLFRLNEIKIKQLRNLAIVSWISLLAPFSWYIIFKGHAWSHYPLNYITWFMPFCLLVLALAGATISGLFPRNIFPDNPGRNPSH